MMEFFIKLLISNLIIIACVKLGKTFPTFGGLIATMPLTSLIVLVWLHTDNPDDYTMIGNYTKGVLWGIIPTAFFFLAVYYCLKRGLPFGGTLAAGFMVWLGGACLHQLVLR
jgi:uncharacterized membrane protein (GlpM family)